MLVPLTADQQRWVDATLDAMTLSECAGQLLCAFAPRNTTEDWLALLEEVPIGALSVMHASSADLRAQLQRLQDHARVPLLVTADLERGANVLTDGTEFPWMMGAGAADDADLMTAMGRASAAEGRYAGIHWTFSPVIDLNYNANNPITNVRAMGDQPERVIRLATAFVAGVQADGRMAATAKHFPGDGVDDRDQHLCTTVNSLPFDQWQATYGRVWRSVIEAGVMAVMPGHISLPDYQGYRDKPEQAPPASLSRKLLHDLLRTELGFQGAIMSDASRMIGIASRINEDERVGACIQAGMDVYLFADAVKDHARLLQAVADGKLSEERVRQAARRVLELKARLNLHIDPFGPQPTEDDKASYRQAAQAMADKSITVLRSDGRPPVDLTPDSRVLTVTIAPLNPRAKAAPQPELDAFDEALRERGFPVTHLLNPDDDLLSAKVAEHDVIFLNLMVLPYMMMGTIRNLVGGIGHWRWRSLFVEHPNVLTTSFGNPYVLHEMPHLPNLVAAFGNSAVSQRAAIKVWLGEIEAQGDCPVKMPETEIRPLPR